MTSKFIENARVYYRLGDEHSRWNTGDVDRVYKNGRFILADQTQVWRPHRDGVTASPSGGNVARCATMTICDDESTPRVLTHNARCDRVTRYRMIEERIDSIRRKWRNQWNMAGAMTDEMLDELEIAVAKLPQP